MSRKKKGIYKKKGNIVKDLTKNIFQILKEDSLIGKHLKKWEDLRQIETN